MITLGDFLRLVENFDAENSLVKVFDNARVSRDCDSLADDVVGFVFGVCVGEAESFLNDTYENAEIIGIYIGNNRELRVLVRCDDSNSSKNNDEPIKELDFPYEPIEDIDLP